MVKPPAVLDGAKILKYAIIDSSVTFTGKITLIVGGKLMGPAAGIAICKYDNQHDFLVLHCDKEWRSFGASGYPTIEEAISRLEVAYAGIYSKWQVMV